MCWRRAGVHHSRPGRCCQQLPGGRLAALVEPPEVKLTGEVGGEFVLITINCRLMSLVAIPVGAAQPGRLGGIGL